MIYVKTALGQTAMQQQSMNLTPRQRSAFIMFDGKRQVNDVLKMTGGIGVTQEDVDHLVASGMLMATGPETDTVGSLPQAAASARVSSIVKTQPVDAPAGKSAALAHDADGVPTLSAQAHYLRAYPIATKLTAGLGLRGFRLNLAVEAAGDLDKLKELAPKIRDAVGAEKFLELENALYY